MAPHYPFVVPSIQQMFIGSPLCFLVGDQEAEWLGSHGYDRRQEVVQRIWDEALGAWLPLSALSYQLSCLNLRLLTKYLICLQSSTIVKVKRNRKIGVL